MGAEIHGGHENNEEYFNRVYNETCRSVSRFVVSKCGNMEDAEDIIQNVYTRFFKRISEKGHEDIESPEAFLINIAKFECRTYFSDRKKDDKVSSFSDYTHREAKRPEKPAGPSRWRPSMENGNAGVSCPILLSQPAETIKTYENFPQILQGPA